MAKQARQRRDAAARLLGVAPDDVLGTFVVSPLDRRWRVLAGQPVTGAPFPLGLVGALLSAGGRSTISYTVVLLADGVALLRNGLRGPRAVQRRRIARNLVGPVRGPMEGLVNIDDVEYTVALPTVDDARRLVGRAP